MTPIRARTVCSSSPASHFYKSPNSDTPREESTVVRAAPGSLWDRVWLCTPCESSRCHCNHCTSFAFPHHIISLPACAYFRTQLRRILTRTAKVPVPITHSFLSNPWRRRTQANKGTGDENRVLEETQRWRKKVAGWRTSFLGIKLCIFSSLLIDQLPQDISMPNQRPAASVYSALQERRLNQTHFSKEKLYLL